jgi:hypothetical protein
MNITKEDIKCTQIEYDSGNPIYKGYHSMTNATDGVNDWWIIKYTYSGDDIIKIQETEGSWTNRATLNW